MSNTDLSSLPPTAAEASQGASPDVPTGDLVRHLFPRNPQRDAEGNAVLYPGMPKYEGVAAMWNTPHGELVILAPTVEALDDQIRYLDLTGGLMRERCIITEARRLPNDSR